LNWNWVAPFVDHVLLGFTAGGVFWLIRREARRPATDTAALVGQLIESETRMIMALMDRAVDAETKLRHNEIQTAYNDRLQGRRVDLEEKS
jgi:hypothetical protein